MPHADEQLDCDQKYREQLRQRVALSPGCNYRATAHVYTAVPEFCLVNPGHTLACWATKLFLFTANHVLVERSRVKCGGKAMNPSVSLGTVLAKSFWQHTKKVCYPASPLSLGVGDFKTLAVLTSVPPLFPVAMFLHIGPLGHCQRVIWEACLRFNPCIHSRTTEPEDVGPLPGNQSCNRLPQR